MKNKIEEGKSRLSSKAQMGIERIREVIQWIDDYNENILGKRKKSSLAKGSKGLNLSAWRLRGQRYRLEGERCPDCGEVGITNLGRAHQCSLEQEIKEKIDGGNEERLNGRSGPQNWENQGQQNDKPVTFRKVVVFSS